MVCPGRMSKENFGRFSLLIISLSDLGYTKQRCDWRCGFALGVPGLGSGMWEIEKMMDGEDREEQMADYFYHLGPISKAVVDIGYRRICSPDVMLVTVSFSNQSFSLFSFNKFQTVAATKEKYFLPWK